MLLEDLKHHPIYLASKSPRRQELLRGMGFNFEVMPTDVPEIYPADLPPEQVVEYLSKHKLSTLDFAKFPNDSIFIACDTIVVLGNKIIEKPNDAADALRMLHELTDNEHTVMSGLTVATQHHQETCHKKTKVRFKKFTDEELEYYVKNYMPLDKAGAYGVQEWIGYVGIDYIEGSFYNVMGLPTKLLWDMLSRVPLKR